VLTKEFIHVKLFFTLHCTTEYSGAIINWPHLEKVELLNAIDFFKMSPIHTIIPLFYFS
jgi:hypothetical protein